MGPMFIICTALVHSFEVLVHVYCTDVVDRNTDPNFLIYFLCVGNGQTTKSRVLSSFSCCH